MRIRLINKMITTYLIGIIISFGIISTLCSKFNYRSELSSQADYMYKTAMSIASEYGNAYSGGDVDDAPSLPFLKQFHGIQAAISCCLQRMELY